MDGMVLGLTVAVLILALALPWWGAGFFVQWEALLDRLAARRTLTIVLVGLLSFLLSAALSLLIRMPQPGVHDEFSYLLAADTFAHGRLTNPPHPLWEHFESMHILQQPTYASKYPPAQGLVLALGQVLTGYPIVGVWLSAALASMALCWMCFAWLPPRWAVLGGLLGMIHPLALTWSQSFWGGAVAAGGGALALGAFRRIVESRSSLTDPPKGDDPAPPLTRPSGTLSPTGGEGRGEGVRFMDIPRIGDAIRLGLGLVILANSRPYEGFVLGLILAGGLSFWLLRGPRPPLAVLLRRLVIPTSTVLLLAGAWMGYYNFRVTGDPLRLPYSVHEAAYCITPIFLWQKPKPEPVYRHPAIREFQTGWAFDFYRRQQTPRGVLLDELRKANTLCKWYLWYYVLLLPLLAVPAALRKDRWLQFTVLACALFAASLAPLTWTLHPHYAAPFLGLFLLLSLQALRQVWPWYWRGQPAGRIAVRSLAVFCAGSFLLFCAHHARHGEGNFVRARMIRELASQGGNHLILVRYSATHNPHDEWVYNEADIDHARVVWAREMDPAANGKLLAYFMDRHAWLLEPDEKPPMLAPYPRP